MFVHNLDMAGRWPLQMTCSFSSTPLTLNDIPSGYDIVKHDIRLLTSYHYNLPGYDSEPTHYP